MTPAGGDSPGAARRIALVLAGLSLTASGVAARVLWDEWRVRRLERDVEVQNAALVRGDAVVVAAIARNPVPRDLADNPRAALYGAVLLARAALATEDPAVRQLRLAAATRSVAAAQARRPDWGEALMLDAYIHVLADDGRVGPRALAALEGSYRFAPYLRDAGAWRAPVGFAVWDRLSPASQTRVANEAVWLARLSASARAMLFAAARESPGYASFAGRWLAARRDDADVLAAARR